MNNKTLRILEYPKIINMLIELAGSELGKDLCSKLEPITDMNDINTLQDETSAALSRIYKHGSISFVGSKDITNSLNRVHIGSCLSASELLAIGSLLDTTSKVCQYNRLFDDSEISDCLESIFTALEPLTHLNNEIKRCIISEAEFSDEASSELKNIRRSIRNANEKITQQLNSMLNSSDTRNMLQETVITMRNGRYCLPVKAEYRSRFQGMIHDQSSTGSTLFIEPMVIVRLNNDIKELFMKEQEEIERILAVLSLNVSEYIDILSSNLKLLTSLDFIYARALLSKRYNASRPMINCRGYINIKKGRHPLLDQSSVVPIDISMGETYSMLIVTGPNTGGKTVALKTVGLLTLMAQSGLHIPAFDGSNIALYHNIFADIGDEQSIEQSLSTFSSHMTNIVTILKNITENSLVLFDELGSGTDPTEGAALAMAILSYLRKKNVTALATTHYSELKIYALSTDGVENACCEFDVDTLRPTYRLLIGIPGKSNAFAISSKLGLSSHIIDNAKGFLSSEDKRFEDLIFDLEKNRTTIENERKLIEQYKEEIAKLKEQTKVTTDKTNLQKEDILQKAREQAREILQEAKDYADKSIKSINTIAKNANIDIRALEKERQTIGSRLKNNNNKLTAEPKKSLNNKIDPKTLKIGDAVHVISLNLDGTVSTLPNAKGDVFVQMGILRSQIHINDLKLREETVITGPNITRTNRGKISMSKSSSIKTSINLLGQTVDEALANLDKYLDDAYLSHLPTVTIVHGKGTGALRTAVQNHLRRSKNVKSFRNGTFGEGEMGVTIVEFK